MQQLFERLVAIASFDNLNFNAATLELGPTLAWRMSRSKMSRNES
jgi:hypothetical protein